MNSGEPRNPGELRRTPANVRRTPANVRRCSAGCRCWRTVGEFARTSPEFAANDSSPGILPDMLIWTGIAVKEGIVGKSRSSSYDPPALVKGLMSFLKPSDPPKS